jgi:lipoprotein-releasing system permease protein
MMAFVGAVIGLLAGLTLCYFQQEYGLVRLDQSASFLFNAYPVEVRLSDTVLVFLTVLFLGLITSVYPSYKAKKLID